MPLALDIIKKIIHNRTMAAERIDLASLEKQELFSSLPHEEIEFIGSRSGLLNLQKKELLFSSGEKAACFYILTNGEIRVFKRSDDGNEEEMARFTSGDTIGDFDFARGAEYDACAEAAEDSQLIFFPGNGFTMETIAREKPRTICSILLNAILMMTKRIKSANKLVLDNLSWVNDLHRRAYEDAGTGLLKQTIIADEVIAKLKDPAALIMLKPDRFKILVDSRGHAAGDEAMIKIAMILKNITRQVGDGWALRFKSNEVGLIINNCDAAKAERIAIELSDTIKAMEKVPAQDDAEEFSFSGTIVWSIWQEDDADWSSLFSGTYSTLLDTWKAGGETVIRYNKAAVL